MRFSIGVDLSNPCILALPKARSGGQQHPSQIHNYLWSLGVFPENDVGRDVGKLLEVFGQMVIICVAEPNRHREPVVVGVVALELYDYGNSPASIKSNRSRIRLILLRSKKLSENPVSIEKGIQ